MARSATSPIHVWQHCAIVHRAQLYALPSCVLFFSFLYPPGVAWRGVAQRGAGLKVVWVARAVPGPTCSEQLRMHCGAASTLVAPSSLSDPVNISIRWQSISPYKTWDFPRPFCILAQRLPVGVWTHTPHLE